MTYPILYSAGHTDFNNLGLGILVDTMSATVTEELNGKFELNMEYLAGGALSQYLVNDAQIKVDTGDQTGQLFRIKTVGKKIDGIIPIYAEHVSYIINDLPIKPKISIIHADGSMALNAALNNVIDKHPLTAYSDVRTIADLEWKLPSFQNIRNILGGVEGSILDRIGGEYQFDNYQIRLLKQRGRYSNTIIAYGRNLTDFEQEESILETYTSIYPIVIETKGEAQTVNVLPEYIVDSEYVDKYPNRRVAMVDFSDKFNDKTPYSEDKLRKFAQSYVKTNKVGVPKVTMKISTVDLSGALDESYNVEEVESLHLADIVKVFFEPLGVTAEAKVVGSVWNVLLEQYDSYTLGAKKASFGQWVNDSVNNIKNIADNAQKSALEAIASANGKNTNYYGNSGDGFPPNPKMGDLYFQKDGNKMTIYQWDGRSWVNVIDASWQEEFKKELQDKLDQSRKQLGEAMVANDKSLHTLEDKLTKNTKVLSKNEARLTDLDKQLSDAQSAINDGKATNKEVVKHVEQAQEKIKAVDSAATRALTEALAGKGLATLVQNDLNNTKTVVSQLSDSITLAVQKNDVINQINVSTEGILIAGEKVHITGTTLIDDAIITTAMIKELDASVIKTGTIAANLIAPNAGNLLMNTQFNSTGLMDGWKIMKSSNITETFIRGGNYTDSNGIKYDSMFSNTRGKGYGSSDYLLLVQEVRAYPNVSYSGSVVGHLKSRSTQGELDIYFLDSKNAIIGYNQKKFDKYNTYTLFKLENAVAPAGTVKIRFQIGLRGESEIYFTAAQLNMGNKVGVYTPSTGQIIVGSDMIVDGAVIAKHLAANAVTAKAIAANAVTAVKIAANSITSDKIEAGAIVTKHLAAGSITATQLAAGAVNMGSATVTGTLDASKIKVINLNASELKAGTLNAATVKIINLDAGAISTGTLNAARIAAGSITADKLAANAIQVGLAKWNSAVRITPYQIAFYNGTKQTSSIDSQGFNLMRDGTKVGHIGANSMRSDDNVRGLDFDLEHGAEYMTWAHMDTAGASTYTTKLTWSNATRAALGMKKGFAFDDDVYFNHGIMCSNDRRITTSGVTFQGNKYPSLSGSSGKAMIAFGGEILYFVNKGKYFSATRIQDFSALSGHLLIPTKIRSDGTVASFYTL